MKIITSLTDSFKPLLAALNSNTSMKDVLDQLTDMQLELDTKYLPIMQEVYDMHGNTRFDSKDAGRLAAVELLFHKTNTRWNRNFITVMYHTTKSLKKQLPELEAGLRSISTSTLVRDAMDLRTANLLKYMDAIRTFLNYSAVLNILVIDTYTAKINPEYQESISDYYAKTQLSPDKVSFFAQLCKTFLANDDTIENKIRKLPDFVLDVDKEGNVTNMTIATANFSSDVLDALGIGRLLSIFNPWNYVYAIRKTISDIRMIYLQCRRNEVAMLEKKIARYKMIKEQGHSTNQLDKVISNMESDVQTKSARLQQWEDEIKQTERTF